MYTFIHFSENGIMVSPNDSQIPCRLFQDVHEREISAATLEIKATSQEHPAPASGSSATHEVAKEKS
jgi:hypothetical protein